ncbi:hypothetical protein [Rhizosphaericola mali]|uniref:Uncharacterized protein n=1 Tax=Rhizosphaericola mali TaxID=2545455 RepID=A0A5P2GAX1_9BACT|nr:hypothetical protein [Rhizosphaericola mali]QES90343.1 hypothetical protein E0W69_017350 [Rhizosphaericola mali]
MILTFSFRNWAYNNLHSFFEMDFIERHIIQRGIENLFPESTINRAVEFKKEFVDFKTIKGTERGIPYEKTESIINKHEKRNFCNWLLENGTTEDFEHFQIIFDIIES